MLKCIGGWLSKTEKVLDVGAGTCNICEILRERGTEIASLDVRNLSFVDGISPIIYDGRKMPFGDKSFDVALILTTLHHTIEPQVVLQEARRVARKIIIIEEIWENEVHKRLTFLLDSLLNLEFINHPHSNKKDVEWRVLFYQLGLRLKETKAETHFIIFKQVAYYLLCE